MKIKFSKGFIPCAIISILVIIAGLVGFFTKGINFGIDFKPGLIEEVRVAPPVAEVTYTGSANATIDISTVKLDVVISGIGEENNTYTFAFADYSTVKALSDAMNAQVKGINVKVLNGDFDSTQLFLNSIVSNKLSSDVLYIYPAGTSDISTDDVRNAFADLPAASVKQLGEGSEASYQVRIGVSETDKQAQILSTINNKLYSAFGKEKVAVVKTDFIGSTSSKSNTIKGIIMFVCTMILIWAYAAIRFHWDFALGSIIALLHDTLIMLAFITWSQVEFSTTVLAAVLTIVGYSINATVVILDRIRYNIKYMPEAKNFKDILNAALNSTFTRSVLTTVTTLFAVVSLYVFTTGSIKDFALCMIVGLISGMYSSIFISSGFILACRKNWKPEYGVHHSLKNVEVQ
ncbi:MAG: protein translocase subunit SecF [Treponema sp.]|nr:protein translocase subunit SecF [Treponema sp.]